MEMETAVRNRLIYGLFCVVISIFLIYFWGISREKVSAQKGNGGALIFLSFAYFLYFAVAVASVYNPVDDAYLVLSGLINMCFLLSLPFFSLRRHFIDHIVEHPRWKGGIYFLGFILLILISWTTKAPWLFTLDVIISAIALGLLGLFISRYFKQRRLNFLAVSAILFFLMAIIVQLNPGNILPGGKFAHPNMSLLAPGLALAVVILAYTFNWINELNFDELSNIWVQDKEEMPGQEKVHISTKDRREKWMEVIAKDDLEKVIEEVIIYKKHKNESLETILNVASRNTRNNNNRLKELIVYEEYQMNRNKLSHALMTLIKE